MKQDATNKINVSKKFPLNIKYMVITLNFKKNIGLGGIPPIIQIIDINSHLSFFLVISVLLIFSNLIANLRPMAYQNSIISVTFHDPIVFIINQLLKFTDEFNNTVFNSIVFFIINK